MHSSSLSVPSEKWRFFTDVGLWPRRAYLDPRDWLSNFEKDELPLANRLLDTFTYYSHDLVRQMYRSAFLNVSQHVVQQKANYISAKSEWAKFVNLLLVVRVTGECPNDADSGFIFSRLSRDYLSIDEEQIVSPEHALQRLFASTEAHVLFADDFVGSGNQFIDTWERQYTIRSAKMSFAQFAALGTKSKFFYCPLVVTQHGIGNILKRCPQVTVVPAHVLSENYSVLHPESIVWRGGMESEGPEFVRVASERAGIPDLDGHVGCWRGFHKLGLTLAFAHGWPDATIPLLYSTSHDWKPLLRKPTS